MSREVGAKPGDHVGSPTCDVPPPVNGDACIGQPSRPQFSFVGSLLNQIGKRSLISVEHQPSFVVLRDASAKSFHGPNAAVALRCAGSRIANDVGGPAC